MNRNLLVIDLQHLLPPIPVQDIERVGFWNLCRLRARFERIVFFSRESDAEFVRRPRLFAGLVKQCFLLGDQEADLVLFTDEAAKGEWCREHGVDVFICDQWPPTREVFSQSAQTLCCFLGSERRLQKHITELWDQCSGVLPQGLLTPTPTWEDLIDRFPPSRRA